MYLYEVNALLVSLYAIAETGVITEGFEYLANEDGSVNTEALEAEINNMFACKEELIEQTAHLVQNLEAEAKMIKLEEERLAARRKKLEERVVRTSDRLSNMVEGTNWSSKVSALKITFRSSEAVIVDNQAEINPAFIKEEVVQKVDKNAIKKALKAGQEVGGCHIEKRNNMTIK